MYSLCFKMLTLVSVLLSTIVFAQEPVNYTPAISQEDINKAWFKPSLLENKNPVLCNALLNKGEQAFFSGVRDLYLSLEDFSQPLEIFWENYGTARNTTKLNMNAKTIYAGAYCYGAGSDNESCTIWASPKEEIDEADAYKLPDTQQLRTSQNIKLVKNKVGNYWLITATSPAVYSIYIDDEWRKYNSDDSFLEAFEVKENSTWEKVCGVTLKPTQNLLLKTKGIDNAFASLKAMYSAASQVTGGSGGVTHGYYTSMFMDRILYRPWSLSASEINPGEIHPAILEWGYLGVNEFEKIANYKKQLEETTKDIAAFYNTNYGWSGKKAYNMAHSAILGALNVDNKFGGYTGLFSVSEMALRKAILEHKPLDEIKAIPVNIQTASAHIAVMYPAALSYLIKKGVDINAQNDFGKTALMYAVQYNQLDSVKTLLEKGANPNLFTVINGEGLTRSGMTALHYAVRYASVDIIKALLNAGAFPFSRTSETENYLPFDWLHIYTNDETKEPNLNISKDQVAEIESLLKPLTLDEIDKKVLAYVLLGEKEYRQNHNKPAAYNNFKFALALDPKNERALNDFALLSITMEKWGEALESSQYIIDNTKNDLTKANAYYNYGLACEKNINQYGFSRVNYNGQYYCSQGLLDPFLKSYELKPMSIKVEKILSVFKERKIKTCNFPTNEAPDLHLSFTCEEGSALCVLSKKDKLLDTKAIFSLENCSFCGADSKILERGNYFKAYPSLLKSYVLNEYQLAIYTGNQWFKNGTLFIHEKVCEDKGIRDMSNYYGDFDRLINSKNETDKYPRENILINAAALHTLFYLTPSYNRLQIKSVRGNLYAQFPDNTYVKVIAGDRLATDAKIYIPKGASFSYSEADLEPDFQNDRILKVMDGDEFMKNEGKGIKVRKYGLVDLNKLTN